MSKVIHHVNALSDITIHDQHQDSNWVLEVVDSSSGSQLETFFEQRLEIGIKPASGGGFDVTVEVMSSSHPNHYTSHWEQVDSKSVIAYVVTTASHSGGNVAALKIVGTDDLIFHLKHHDNSNPVTEYFTGLYVEMDTSNKFRHYVGHR